MPAYRQNYVHVQKAEHLLPKCLEFMLRTRDGGVDNSTGGLEMDDVEEDSVIYTVSRFITASVHFR